MATRTGPVPTGIVPATAPVAVSITVTRFCARVGDVGLRLRIGPCCARHDKQRKQCQRAHTGCTRPSAKSHLHVTPPVDSMRRRTPAARNTRRLVNIVSPVTRVGHLERCLSWSRAMTRAGHRRTGFAVRVFVWAKSAVSVGWNCGRLRGCPTSTRVLARAAGGKALLAGPLTQIAPLNRRGHQIGKAIRRAGEAGDSHARQRRSIPLVK